LQADKSELLIRKGSPLLGQYLQDEATLLPQQITEFSVLQHVSEPDIIII